MSEILIVVPPCLANDIESYLEGLAYSKIVKPDSGVAFEFDYESWGDPEDTFPPSLMTYLFSVVGMESYAFVRLGSEPDDVEIHGNLDGFNVHVHTEVSY